MEKEGGKIMSDFLLRLNPEDRDVVEVWQRAKNKGLRLKRYLAATFMVDFLTNEEWEILVDADEFIRCELKLYTGENP